MKSVLLCLLLSLVATVSGQVFAVAVVRGTALDAGIFGTVTLSQAAPGGNVTVSVNISGITVSPDALHGLHFHTAGDLRDKAAAQAVGGHWSGPNNPIHGCPDSNGTGRHLGDTGNWQATNGAIVGTKTLDLLALSGVDSVVGRPVILHANTDDCVTIASSGGRLAQGVVGIVNSTVYGGNGEASQAYPGITAAVCVLEPASGTNVTGVVYLTQTAGTGAVTVTAVVEGISGPHGFHLHWFGDITAPNGLSTGAHYNPLGALHGIPPFTRHVGDLGIISYYENGVAYYKYVNDLLSLNGPNSVIGRAIHVHQNSDDCVNPVGNGGARWAQCVVGILTNTTSVPTPPAAVIDTQNGASICQGVYPLTSAPTVALTTGAPVVASTDGNVAASVVISFATLFVMLVLAF